jgi:hypothetical protein
MREGFSLSGAPRDGIKGVLELEAEELAVGEEGELDTVTEGAMPGDGVAISAIVGDDKAPLRGTIRCAVGRSTSTLLRGVKRKM